MTIELVSKKAMIKETLGFDEIIVMQYAINYCVKTAMEQFHYARYTIASAFERIDPILHSILESYSKKAHNDLIQNNFDCNLEEYWHDNSRYISSPLILWKNEMNILSKLDIFKKFSAEIEFTYSEMLYIYSALSSYEKGDFHDRLKNYDRRKLRPDKMMKAHDNLINAVDGIMRRWSENDENFKAQIS